MNYQDIFEHINDCVAVYKAINNGKDFVFTEFNCAAEKLEKVKKKNLIGKNVKEVFPGIEKFGLLEVFQRVWKSGKPELFPVHFYEDNKIKAWRENFIYKLPDGQIIAIYNDLTEAKQREEDVEKEKDRFKEFIELLPEMVCEADLDGKIILANIQAFKQFQFTQKDLDQGITLDKLFIPRDLRRARVNLKKKIKGLDIPTQEYTVRRKDNSTFPALTYFSVFHRNGKPAGVRGVMVDITDRKKQEQALEVEKAYLEQLFDEAPEAIVQIVNNKIARINKEFTRLFGYSDKESVGQNIDKLLPNADQYLDATTISKKISMGDKVYAEVIRHSKSGNPINVSIMGTPVKMDNKVIGNFGIYRDITERIKAEKIQQLINNISTAVLTSGNLEGLLDIVKQELDTVLDTTNLFIAFYNKEDNTLYFPFFVDEKDKFEEISIEKTITGYVIKSERPVLLKHPDLEKLENEGEIDLIGSPSKVWLGVPLHTKGEIFGVISLQSYDNENAFSEDDLDILVFVSNQISLAITKIHAEDNLRIAKQKAEEAAIAKQQFLSTMSHEIRTPMNAVIGMSQLLLEIEPRPDQLEYLTALKYSGETLLALINDILDYSKLESDKVILEKLNINPLSIVKEIIKVLTLKAKERDNVLKLGRSEGIPKIVIGDKVRLGQILTNLIGNAIKFTTKGKIEVCLELEKETEQECIIKFLVKDTGIGISKDKLDIIFDSFTQERSDITRRFGGSGLGLAISKKLVEIQKGEIHVSSVPNKGSTFSFTIPFKKSKFKEVKITKTIDHDNKSLAGLKILIVEDNQINRLVARKFLENWDVKVDEAENGKVSLGMVEKNSYDLVLMDLQMPEMDGFEATRIIKTMHKKKYKNLPVIALTASILIEVKEKIEEAGLDDFLIKPFDATDLFNMIYSHVYHGKQQT
ncbi:MAG: PAS domain S-box protein [Bacteroidota bacterium]|nr:PAS domain S-box protein [Bacteroidota bacterium]